MVSTVLAAGLMGTLSACSGGSPTTSNTEVDAARTLVLDGGVEEIDEPRQVDLVAAGRALEAGELERARELLGDVEASSRSRYLGALIALERGEHDEAIRLLRLVAGFREELEDKRKRLVLDALAGSGKLDEAVSWVNQLLESGGDLGQSRRRSLQMRRGGWLMELGRTEEAIASYEEAREGARGSSGHRIDLLLAGALLARKEDQKARSRAIDLLEGLARTGETSSIMRRALKALEDDGAVPEWTGVQRIERARRLTRLRAWDEASETLASLVKLEDSTGDEARWANAQLLFKRRRHYGQAVKALRPIIAGKGPHAAEARFLMARSLSRQDLDEQAIKEYRAFARASKQPGRAAEARFLSCRLEFYLGHHKQAVVNLEKLVGNGKKARKVALGPGRVRDAHFLAGLSAILWGKPARAEAHLKAASKGSSSAEAIERNKYWYAVARLESKKKDGAGLLREVCASDPLGWYSMVAARRLEEAKAKLGACIPKSPDTAPGADAGVVKNTVPAPGKPLSEISDIAEFYAGMGLYREAAAELRAAEKRGVKGVEAREWIENYVALDAPHHAIRRASRGLKWPPEAEKLWQALSAYPRPYLDLVREQEESHGLPRDLIYAVARKESLFDPHAVSGVGAMGMMQMMPHTYETNRKRAGLEPLGEGELPSPQDSIKAAACELEHLLEKFEGSLPLAIMAYNGGAVAVTRWLERSGGTGIDVFVEKAGFAQTRNYVRRVYGILARYRALDEGAPPVLPLVAEVADAEEGAKSDGGTGTDAAPTGE